MTDKEKIRKEIEKRYEYWKEKEFNSHSVESEIRMSECQHLLLMIDSLQDEPCNRCQGYNNKEECDTLVFGHNCPIVKKPVNEDLEEAAKNHAVERYRVTRDRELAEKCKWSFKAGAQWQKKQDSILPKIWPRENLDDFAYQVAYDLSNDWMRETPTWDDVETAVKLGARWQKEKDQKK